MTSQLDASGLQGLVLRKDFNPHTSDVDVVAAFDKRGHIDPVRQYFEGARLQRHL
jgi:hypothetical protein